MTDTMPIIVTWNCGHCDVIHEQGFENTDADKNEVMTLCAMIVINEDEPDFQVRVKRDDVYMDDTANVIIALVTHAVRDLFGGTPNTMLDWPEEGM